MNDFGLKRKHSLTIGIIGGGAAGYFAAIRHKELYPDHEVIIFEKTSKVLGKVKISGGGRCNVTHACIIPKELIQYYPRGAKELIGSFHRFQPSDTIAWFERNGVELKTEEDGRMFPVTDQSETIIDLFQKKTQELDIRVKLKHQLKTISNINEGFRLNFEASPEILVDRLIITTGSNESIWQLLRSMGHSIIPPVPSLFTFNIKDDRLALFPGVSWTKVHIQILNTKYESLGPLLITHWGLSGPAILKLSSFAAVYLHEKDYRFEIKVNFMYPNTVEETVEQLKTLKNINLNKLISNTPLSVFTSRVWQGWMELLGHTNKRWQEISSKDITKLSEYLTQAIFKVDGKSTFKEEFVTAGGVDLKEVNMKTMESKKIKNLFFAGEVLNIDALTGGFNFQAAWTTAWIAGGVE